MWSIVPLRTVEIVWNGDVVRTLEATGDRLSVDVDESLEIEGSGWLHIRVEGTPEDRWPLDTAYPQAATNPVWVTVAGQPIRSAAAADYAIRWIDKLEDMAEEWPGWRSDREREHVYAQFEEAREIFRARGAEAGGR